MPLETGRIGETAHWLSHEKGLKHISDKAAAHRVSSVARSVMVFVRSVGRKKRAHKHGEKKSSWSWTVSAA